MKFRFFIWIRSGSDNFILFFFNRLPAQEGVGVLRSFLRRPPVPGVGYLSGCGDIRKKRRRTPTTDQLSLRNTHIVAENCPCGRACENAWHELARDRGERNERHARFSAVDYFQFPSKVFFLRILKLNSGTSLRVTTFEGEVFFFL